MGAASRGVASERRCRCRTSARHDQPHAEFLRIDHVGIAVRRPGRGDRVLRAGPSACAACTRRSTRSRASARRCSPSATPAAASSCWRRCAGLADREVPGPAAARASSRWRTRSTTSRRRPRTCAARACGCSTTSRDAGTAGSPGQLRPPQGRRRGAGRAGPARFTRRVGVVASVLSVWSCGRTTLRRVKRSGEGREVLVRLVRTVPGGRKGYGLRPDDDPDQLVERPADVRLADPEVTWRPRRR